MRESLYPPEAAREWTVDELYELALRAVCSETGFNRDKATQAHEDDIQEMVLAAWRKVERAPLTWTLVNQTMRTEFARNQERVRKQSEGDVSVAQSEDGGLALVEETTAAHQRLEWWMRHLDTTETQRKVIAALIRFDGDHSRVAQELGVGRGTVSSVLQNVKRKAARFAEANPDILPEGEEGQSVPGHEVEASEDRSEGVAPGEAPGLPGVLSGQGEVPQARPSRNRSGEGPGTSAVDDPVSDLPQDSGDGGRAQSESSAQEGPGDFVASGAGEAASAGQGAALGVQILREFFVHRTNPYAVMWTGDASKSTPEGRQSVTKVAYRKVEEELTDEQLERHLAGQITLGVYSTDERDTVKWVCWDIDTLDMEPVLRLWTTIPGEKLLEFSGSKGHHIWQFFDEPWAAADAKVYGEHLADRAEVDCEVFPKQGSTKGGLGNLVKLPCGVHLKTGERSRIVRGWPVKVPTPTINRINTGDLSNRVAGTLPDAQVSQGWIAKLFDGGLNEGGRNNGLNRLIVWLLARGVPDDVVAAFAHAANVGYCSPPLDNDDMALLLRPRNI